MNAIDEQMIASENLYTVRALQSMADEIALPENMGLVIWHYDGYPSGNHYLGRGFYLDVNNDDIDLRYFLGRNYSPAGCKLMDYLSSPETLMDMPF